MDVGIGLPNPIPGTSGPVILDWARRAEEAGFSSVATIDRIAYPSYESLTCLAAVAGTTRRIGLLTNILLAPTRSPAVLAKQAASLDQLSDGRLTLGLGVGTREDDYATARMSFSDRGRRLDDTLDVLHLAWRGEPVAGSDRAVTPAPVRARSIPILIGGRPEYAFERVLRWGAGWTAGGGMPPDLVRRVVEELEAAWREAGLSGKPKIVALTYYALGDRAQEATRAYIADYYAYLGQGVEQFAESVPKTPAAVQDAVEGYAEAGVHELILDPVIAEAEQVDLLADCVL